MDRLFQELNVKHPTVDDAQVVFDLLNACDIAEYGQSDTDLEDILHEWKEIELDQDAWLVFSPENKLIGYAAVFTDDSDFTFDFHTHPQYEGNKLHSDLLAQCEARANFQMNGDQETSAGSATTIISQVNLVDRQVLEKAEFIPQKYFFRMQIELDTIPVSPAWPENCTLQTTVPKQDDEMIYDFINVAFDRPGRTPPAFERWRDYMMRPDHFESDLWFLLFCKQELIGAALCYDYSEHGWVRQLAVEPSWRRNGLGAALLQQAFHTFFQQGHKKIALGVDSQHPNAQSLYENVGMKRVRRFDEYHKHYKND